MLSPAWDTNNADAGYDEVGPGDGMKVYVLTRGVPYEGEDIVGVYSTPEKADEAEAEGRADSDNPFCYWNIMEFEVQ